MVTQLNSVALAICSSARKRPILRDGLIISDRIHLLQCTTTFDGFPSLNPRLLRADIQIKGTGVASTLLRVHAPVEQSDNNHATAQRGVVTSSTKIPRGEARSFTQICAVFGSISSWVRYHGRLESHGRLECHCSPQDRRTSSPFQHYEGVSTSL